MARKKGIMQERINHLQKLEEAYLDADWEVMNDPSNQHWWYKAHEAAVALDRYCKKQGFMCIARKDNGELAY